MPRGPKTIYWPKELPNITLMLSAHAKRTLTAAARRTRQSRSNIIEYLLRTFGEGLSTNGRLRPKIRPNQSVSLTAHAKQLADEYAARLGDSRSNIVERLIVSHASRLTRQHFKDAEEHEDLMRAVATDSAQLEQAHG